MSDNARNDVDLETVAKFLNSLIDRERAKQNSTRTDATESRTNQNNISSDHGENNNVSKGINDNWNGMDPTMSMFLHMDAYAAPTAEDSPMHNHSWLKADFEHTDDAAAKQSERIDAVSQSESTMLETLGFPLWNEVPPQHPEDNPRQEAVAPVAEVHALCHKLREKLHGLQEIEKSLEGYCAEMSSRHKDLAEQLTRLHEVVSDNAERMQDWASKVHSALAKVSPEI